MNKSARCNLCSVIPCIHNYPIENIEDKEIYLEVFCDNCSKSLGKIYNMDVRDAEFKITCVNGCEKDKPDFSKLKKR
jgi:peptide methionine sulfoxide reductase MsrB